jgi:hypothetical protein
MRNLEKDDTEFISLANNIIALKFFNAESGFGLNSLLNQKTKHEFLFGQTHGSSLWKIKFKHTSNQVITIDNNVECNNEYIIENSADNSSRTLHLYWRDISLDEEENVVEVHASIRIDTSLSFWRINVINDSKKYGLWEIAFPVIRGIIATEEENISLAYPDKLGRILRNPVSKMPVEMYYPSFRATMQFSTLFELKSKNGLYFATYDSNIYTKRFFYDVDGVNERLRWDLKCYPNAMGVPGSDYTMTFDAVIGVYIGDWITAAKMYRKWALNQKWCSKGKLKNRNDIPKWFFDTPIWFAGTPNDKMISLKKILGVPVAYQWYRWYRWYQFPGRSRECNPNPDYFNYLQDDFTDNIRKLHDASIKIIPYINARLWNTDVEIWKTENAEPYACKVPYRLIDELISYRPWEDYAWGDLTKYMEHWGGSNQTVMCPYTSFYQNKQQEIVDKLVKDYGVDGLYVDQTGSCTPVLCFDPTHGHSTGGGNYWGEGYRQMLKKLRQNARNVNQDVIFTTEGNAEPYIDLFDGLLACNSTNISPDLIPLYHYVYSGYALTYGRSTGGGSHPKANEYTTGLPFIMRNAQLFTWGEQLGWFNPKIIDIESQEVDYLKLLSKTLQDSSVKDFLFFSEMVRPPIIDGDNPLIMAQWKSGQEDTVMPAVMHSAWKSDSGALGLVFTNIDDSPHTVNFLMDLKDYGFTNGQYLIKVIAGNNKGKEERYDTSVIKRTEKLPERRVLVLEIKSIE